MACATVVLSLAPLQGVWAAGDHGGPKAITVAPRAEARVGTRQFVLVYANRQLFEDRKFQFFGNIQRPKFDRPRLALFVEDFATAEPVAGAEVEANINFLPEAMSEIAPGVYVTGEVVLGGGRNDVEIAYTIGDEAGTVEMLLVVAGGSSADAVASAAGVTAVRPVAIPSWVFVVAGLAVYGIAAGLFLLRRSRSARDAVVEGHPH
ncbi:MAG: hypothetical protein RLO51_06420 [Thalassobaculum sp.]|uniref:hypothetical protein n=1 Tax=Thalassobaculum sp. TaxID=2022740 RepID=UPI0032ED142C